MGGRDVPLHPHPATVGIAAAVTDTAEIIRNAHPMAAINWMPNIVHIILCIHVFMYSCIYVFMYLCIHVFMYVCIYYLLSNIVPMK